MNVQTVTYRGKKVTIYEIPIKHLQTREDTGKVELVEEGSNRYKSLKRENKGKLPAFVLAD